MTTFKASLGLCGLSQKEAAEYLGVSLDSVKGWCRGKTPPPRGVWDALSDLLARIEGAADNASSMIEPDLMDRAAMNNVEADAGENPLPSGADAVAGALALLLAIRDVRGDL